MILRELQLAGLQGTRNASANSMSETQMTISKLSKSFILFDSRIDLQ